MANSDREIEPKPPVGGSWPRVYAFVIGVLAAVIAALWALSEWFS